ncbi:Glutamate receptor 2.7 [Linum grandiflorum]
MLRLHLFFFFFFLLFVSSDGANSNRAVTKIGAVIDMETRIGREQRLAMEIAARDFHNVSLSFRSSGGSRSLLLGAAYAAEELIRDESAEVIFVGTDSWEEAVLVAGAAVGVPVVTFASSAVRSPPPNLVRIGYSGDRRQMRCVAALVRSYNWRRVVAVYEENLFGGDSSGEVNLLADALREVGAEIEHRVVLPVFPSSSVRDELMTVVKSVKSRVFIVLRSSVTAAVEFFHEANRMGLVGPETAWILTETVTDYLDSVNSSVLYSVQGALGIKNQPAETSEMYRQFRSRFGREFRLSYPDEHYSRPSFAALRGYDAVLNIALRRSNFTGLSSEVGLRIVNVVGNGYKKLDFWVSESEGFSSEEMKKNESFGEVTLKVEGPVTWPGDMKKEPKGWGMPTAAKPLVIGVPGSTVFEKFVKVSNGSDDNTKKYEGFCIDLFKKVMEVLDYDLPYEFVPYYGKYEDLVDNVYNKTYDAVVGDMTILADRLDKVEFTQPFAESGLSMIVPARSEKSAWMFMKPFTMEMWLVTGTILVYTMLIIWFLEHQTNPDFKGPLRNQMGTALLFTFSSLFFAHREKVYNNLTRIVLVVWLFVVLILNSSYTASLTSMLTVLQLKPNVTDIDWLRRNNLRVGCDGDSFVRTYLEKVLEFNPDNIQNVDSEYKFEPEFDTNQISAAFMELPYQKVFINHYCKRFTATPQTFRFGGLGFVFQKGSPIAADVSKAILKLSEDGHLKKLEEIWFAPSIECSSEEDGNPERLGLQNFWGLFAISSATSTVCLVICLWHLLSRKYREDEDQGDVGVWNKTVRLVKYLYYGKAAIGRVYVMPTVTTGSSPGVSDPPRTPDDPRIPAAVV